MILNYLLDIPSEDYSPAWDFVPTERPVYSSVDWLTATNPKIDRFHSFIKKFMPMMRSYGFSFEDSGKGMNGYTHYWKITMDGDLVGHICADALDKMGGMFQLTGAGCQWLQARWDLWCMLVAGLNQYGFVNKRLDVAVDCVGSVWDEFGVTIVDFCRSYRAGMFTIGSGCGVKPGHSLVGDWMDLVLEDKAYDPKAQCPNGLTLNIGLSTGVNSWCIYEKGKQLAGKNPERYDGSLNGHVRIERRFRSGSGRGQVVIPWDFAVSPDSAFVYNCSGVDSFVNRWLDFQRESGVDLSPVASSDLELERVGLTKGVSIKKTALHVAQQSSRFFKTLEMIGVDVLDFVNLVKHKECNKGFNLGLYQSNFSDGGGVMDFLRGEFE